MEKRLQGIKFEGNPVTLLGPELVVGDKAPNFQVVDTDLKSISFEDFKGKTKIICTVPSLDTPVCATEVRKFNEETAHLDANTVVLIVSADLPFAQKRWCAGNGIDRLKVLSDYQDYSFAFSYGVLIKELKLLARSIFIVDKDDTIRYVQYVSELTDEPDYRSALEAAKGGIVTKQIFGDEICGGY